MSARDVFLSRLRDRLSRGGHPNAAHPVADVSVLPDVAYARDLTDPVSAFAEAAASAGSVVSRVTSDEELRELVASLGAATAVLTRDPEAQGVRPALEAAGVEVLDPREAASAELGVAGGAWGIAATGSVVCDSARAGGRTVSLLPPSCLFCVRTDHVVPTAADVFRRMRDRYPDGPPPGLVLATGPSRSADIELTLTVGVHGPARVWVAIMDGGRNA